VQPELISLRSASKLREGSLISFPVASVLFKPSTANSQQSTVNSQESTANSQQSTINITWRCNRNWYYGPQMLARPGSAWQLTWFCVYDLSPDDVIHEITSSWVSTKLRHPE